jgi:hypothetical protein
MNTILLSVIIAFSGASGLLSGMDMVREPSESLLIQCLMLLETSDIIQAQPAFMSLMNNYGSLISTPRGLGEAADAAYRLMLTDTGDSLLSVLSIQYSESEALFHTAQRVFLRTVYTGTTENDPSGRAALAENYLRNYSSIHPYWTGTAYGVISGDSVRPDGILEEWTERCPESPVAWLARAESAAEDSMWEEEFEYAAAGHKAVIQWAIPGMPEEQRLLVFPALENHLRMRMAEALWKLGEASAALDTLEPLLFTDLYPVTDYHSPAPFFLLAGKILNSHSHLITAAVLGDLENEYSGEAERLLKMAIGPAFMDSARVGYTGPVFQDRTEQILGIDPVPGVRNTWEDLNDDGFPDLIIGDRVYVNNGETLSLSTTLNYPCNGAAAADLNGDGFTDIVTGGYLPMVWLTDESSLKYRPVSLQIPPGPVEGIVLTDLNGDGLTDICLAVYETPDKTGEGNTDMLYLNNGDGTFTESDILSTWPYGPWCGRDADPVDFDNDGLMDLYISNYRNQPNVLWHNLGSYYENIAKLTNTEGDGRDDIWGNTIGSAWGDYDNDGDQDLFNANLAHPRDLPYSDRSMLLRNDGGVFTDVTQTTGIRYEETHAYPAWADFNCDGNLDLYITSTYENRRSFLYLNNGDGSFTDVTWLSGTRVFNSWGLATPDINMDGMPDLAVNENGRLRIFINTGTHTE